MFFILGIIIGIGLSTIALYGATRHAKAINSLFTVNPINNNSSTSEIIRKAEIIHRETPQDKFLKNE